MPPPDDDIAAGVRPGDVLVGKYRVERVLGVGGMGVVVAAHHLQLDETVALKFLLPEALANAEAVARFEREARAAAKIKNEHVARVSDVGALENGSPYMVMEYLDGYDLSEWATRHGAMSVEQAVDFVLQACEALAEAHVQGIVHRDLKPANLFCIQRSDGPLCIKVLDFGISKITTPGAPAHHLTRTTTLMGSPLYMSPEQMQSSKSVDARSDIWSLGVILYELLTTRPPFDAQSVTELAIKVATEPPVPLTTYRSDIAPGLEAAIMKALEKDKERRFASIAELALALQEFAPGHARLSVERAVGTLRRSGSSGGIGGQVSRATTVVTRPSPLPSDDMAVAQTAAMTSSSWQSSVDAKRGNKAPLIAAGVVALFVVGGLAFWKLGATTPVVAVPLSSAPVPGSMAPPVSGADGGAGSLIPAPPPTMAAPQTPDPPTPSVRPSVVHTTTPLQPPTVRSNAVVTVAPPPPTPVAPAPARVNPGATSCDPPYYFDAKGTRVFKKECL